METNIARSAGAEGPAPSAHAHEVRPAYAPLRRPARAQTLDRVLETWAAWGAPLPVAVVVSVFDDLLALAIDGDVAPGRLSLSDVVIEPTGFARLVEGAVLSGTAWALGPLFARALGHGVEDDAVPAAARGLVARLASVDPLDRPADAEQVRSWLRETLGAPATREEVAAALSVAFEPEPVAGSALPAPELASALPAAALPPSEPPVVAVAAAPGAASPSAPAADPGEEGPRALRSAAPREVERPSPGGAAEADQGSVVPAALVARALLDAQRATVAADTLIDPAPSLDEDDAVLAVPLPDDDTADAVPAAPLEVDDLPDLPRPSIVLPPRSQERVSDLPTMRPGERVAEAVAVVDPRPVIRHTLPKPSVSLSAAPAARTSARPFSDDRDILNLPNERAEWRTWAVIAVFALVLALCWFKIL